jgi:hypothetical protein
MGLFGLMHCQKFRTVSAREFFLVFCRNFSPKSSFELPKSHNQIHWYWACPWTFDKTAGLYDEEGWAYGKNEKSSFKRGQQKKMDSLRRRRWFRIRIVDSCSFYDRLEVTVILSILIVIVM